MSKIFGTIQALRRAIQDPAFTEGQLFLMRRDEHAELMMARKDGAEYNFRQLRFDVTKSGDDVKITLNRALGPRGFRNHYEGLPRGTFYWQWFETAIEFSVLDSGQDIPDAHSREFVRLADFIVAVAYDEEETRSRRRRPEVRATPHVRGEESPSLSMTRH